MLCSALKSGFLQTGYLWQHRTIPALRLKHRSGGSPRQEPPQAAVALRSASLRLGVRHGICVAKMLDNTQSIICAFGLAAAAPRSPYRHLELCGIALNFDYGLLAVYFCGLHRILFKINSPYGKAKFGSFLFRRALRLSILLIFRQFLLL